MTASPVIAEATQEDAPAIATIHLDARRQAMPWLRSPYADDEAQDYFGRVVGDRPRAWWVARHDGQVAAYMLIDGEDLDHLYVAPRWQGLGFGSALLAYAKSFSPSLVLWTFQRNARARAFYEARGFVGGRQTDGENKEREPDVQHTWAGA